ncbi:MAG: hypothetical protein JST54_22440 [Deltaproteobacteria bacterium]|nr:hypothetical protein [Deltaproteobacteria bacterium]
MENVPGKAVLRYVDGSPELRINLSNHFPTGMVFVLELHGAKDVKASITRDEVVEGKLLFEITLTYLEK